MTIGRRTVRRVDITVPVLRRIDPPELADEIERRGRITYDTYQPSDMEW